jgi:hypothetical protein
VGEKERARGGVVELTDVVALESTNQATELGGDPGEVREGVKCVRLQTQRKMKGKCALGPFLSILVIECQHKWTYVNLCKVMDRVQIK